MMFMSTLTPGAALSVCSNAAVDTTSTSVAVKPPCNVPPLFVCSSSTFNSHTTFPGVAERSFICINKRGIKSLLTTVTTPDAALNQVESKSCFNFGFVRQTERQKMY